MKAKKLFYLALIVIFTSLVADFNILMAGKEKTCLECFQTEGGSFDCRSAYSGYINCDKSNPSQNCVMTTTCR